MKKVLLSEDVKSKITAAIDEHWNKSKSALPLAALGQRLIRNGLDLKSALDGNKMKAVLELDLAPDYVVRKVQGKDLSYEILPKQASEEAPSLTSSATVTKPNNWLPSALWLAFTRPVSADRVRAVNLNPFRFEDILRTAANEEMKVIWPSDIVVREEGEASSDWASRVQVKLTEWLESHSLSMDDIRSRPTPSESLFDKLLANLNKSQKERILIPLDIVEHLKGLRS